MLGNHPRLGLVGWLPACGAFGGALPVVGAHDATAAPAASASFSARHRVRCSRASATSAGSRRTRNSVFAIVTWCLPLCITPVVAAATNVTIAVTYELWLYKSCNRTVAEVRTAVSAALGVLFSQRPIGGDVVAPATTGKIYQSDILATIVKAIPEGFRASVTVPSGDTSLTNGQVAVLGTVTGTIHLEDDPV